MCYVMFYELALSIFYYRLVNNVEILFVLMFIRKFLFLLVIDMYIVFHQPKAVHIKCI